MIVMFVYTDINHTRSMFDSEGLVSQVSMWYFWSMLDLGWSRTPPGGMEL